MIFSYKVLLLILERATMQNRIKELRKRLNLTQEELGAALGVSASAVGGWEYGTRNVSETARLLICERFHVSRDWLESGAGGMFQQEAALNDAERVKRLAGDLVALLPKKERRAFIESVKELENRDD